MFYYITSLFVRVRYEFIVFIISKVKRHQPIKRPLLFELNAILASSIVDFFISQSSSDIIT